VQLVVHASGEVELIGSLLQESTPAGAPRGHRGRVTARGEIESGLACDAELRDAALRVVRVAASQGYRGPCGVDSFAFRHPESDEECLRPVVELNARFTVGTVAIGLARRALRGAAAPLCGPLELAFALDGDSAAAPAGATRERLAAGRAALYLWRGQGQD
jgi:hypothetical protein